MIDLDVDCWVSRRRVWDYITLEVDLKDSKIVVGSSLVAPDCAAVDPLATVDNSRKASKDVGCSKAIH